MKASTSWLLALLLAGCAASPAPGGATPSTLQADDEQTSDLDELVRRLSKSEQELERELALASGTATTEPEDAAGEAPAEPAAEAPTEAEAEPEAAPRRPSPCETACRALASMQRSTARICELAGETDDRCIGAKDRVERAEARVNGAGCRCG